MPSRNRGKKKLSLRDLSRLLPSDEDRLFLKMDLLSKSPPIVRAIVGQALVESALDYLLRPRFVRNDDDAWAELTDDNGPLSTFRRKIVAAHALGICDDGIRDALHAIRRIRNAFAHSRTPLNFEHALIKQVLTSLKTPEDASKRIRTSFAMVRTFPKVAIIPSDEDASGTPTEMAFAFLCVVVNGELHRRYKARARAWIKRGKTPAEQERRRAILDDLKSPLARLLEQTPGSHTDDQTEQSPAPSPQKPRRTATKQRRSPDNGSG